jgi:acyl-CoA dehydrogenase
MATLHSDIIAPSLHNLCADEKKVRWLPKLATGEIILAVAIKEPDPGYVLPGFRTRTIETGTTETMKYIIAKNLRLV